MSFKVKTIPEFENAAKKLIKKYPSLKNELIQLVNTLIELPTSGTSLGKNCYKIRIKISSKGKGKSGGGRVITYFYISEGTVYLLYIYDKSDKNDISDIELKQLLSSIE